MSVVPIFFLKNMSPNLPYKKCTRRVLVWYKKLVPGTIVLFLVFVTRPCWILENSKGSVFIYRFRRTGTRNFQILNWKRDRKGWEEGNCDSGGVDVSEGRRICPCGSRSEIQNGRFWKGSDTM